MSLSRRTMIARLTTAAAAAATTRAGQTAHDATSPASNAVVDPAAPGIAATFKVLIITPDDFTRFLPVHPLDVPPDIDDAEENTTEVWYRRDDALREVARINRGILAGMAQANACPPRAPEEWAIALEIDRTPGKASSYFRLCNLRSSGLLAPCFAHAFGRNHLVETIVVDRRFCIVQPTAEERARFTQ